MKKVSRLIPEIFGQPKSFSEAYEEVGEFKDWADAHKDTFDIASKLEGLVKNKGIHASAIALSHDSLEDSCPIELTKDKSFISALNMDYTSISI